MIGPAASEHQEQTALMGLLRYRMRREIVCFSIPNGGLRNPRVQQQLIDSGLLPGAPDLYFAREEGRSLFMEMKTKKGVLSDVQQGVKFKLEALGHDWVLARSVDEAMEHLSQRGLLR